MKTVDLIAKLEATSSLNEKKSLLSQAFENGNRDFFVGAKLAYNKLISFGVKKVPGVEESSEESNFSFSDFTNLVNRLRKREITGHAARDEIADAAMSADATEWNNFYRRVLLRDLKVNVGSSLINTVLKEVGKSDREALEYLIPAFECQLAEDSKKHPKKMSGRKLIDVKLDGARMLTVLDIDNQAVRMFTRNGIETFAFPHIAASLTGMLSELPMSIVLDGEILSDTFQGLMSQFQRKDADTKDMKLGLFDVIPLSDFTRGKCLIAQDKRHETLVDLQTSGLLQKYTGDKVYVIPKMEVDLSTPEGLAAMKAYFDEAVAAGFEGIMIKDPKAGYEGRKYSAWLKWKPTISVTLKVVGLQQGEPDSAFAGTLGALVLEGWDDVDDKTNVHIKSNCGSGFDVKTRQGWWDNPETIMGFMVEIEADAITLNKDATQTYSLRFPRLKGVRGTKPGEKI